MQKLPFQISKDRSLQILCLGAHSDDIEIGCGGTMLRLKEEYKDIDVTWVVFSAKGEREIEAQESADAFLSGIRQRSIRLLKFRDGYYPYQGPEIKELFRGA